MKILGVIFLGAFLAQLTTAEEKMAGMSIAEMKDEQGNYRHHDPKVRAEFLSITEALHLNRMFPKAESLYKVLTRKWSAAGYDDDLNKACEGLFATLLGASRLEEYETVMKSCPAEQVRKQFLSLADRSSFVGKVNIYRFIISHWKQPEQQEDLAQACQKLVALTVTQDELADFTAILQNCSPADIRQGQLLAAGRYMDERYRNKGYEKKAVALYEEYLSDWQIPETEEERSTVCAALTTLYLEAGDAGKVDNLTSQCKSSSINKGYLLRARHYELWGKASRAIREYRVLIDRWEKPSQSDDQFRACQFLYWLLVQEEKEEQFGARQTNCPQVPYSRIPGDASQSPLMAGYLAILNKHNSNLHVPLKRIQPRYPQRALERGISGYVIVEFDVDQMGKPENLKVVESNSKLFHKEALKAAKELRYRPLVADGEAKERSAIRYQFTFEVDNGNPWDKYLKH